MNVFNKKLVKNHYSSSILDALGLVIPAVMLTADDIWCVTNEQTQQLVKGSFEIIEGYKEEHGKKALTEIHKEFAERGIQIEIHNGFSTPPYKIPERGRGVWKLVEVDQKKKTICSRCGKGNAIKTPYCGWCGANMKPRENSYDA